MNIPALPPPTAHIGTTSGINANVGTSNLSHIQEQQTDINILLLGETGVGKSTFINSFVNYISYLDFTVAEQSETLALIPAQFVMYTDDDEEKIIKIGDDENEFVETGASATQGAKSYVFPLNETHRLRIIDTPGIGDTRGIEHDNKNFENILRYISQFKYLNAICILLKPNNCRLNVMFEFCIKQLLSHLERTASNNIIFVFTNSRTTFYKPGETKPLLKKLLDGVKQKPPFVEIPLNSQNTFCLDNEAFRFLIACKQGLTFDEQTRNNFIASWDFSVDVCKKIIRYIVGDENQPGIVPHRIQDTISVNEARRIVIQLSKPLADISELIHINIRVLKDRKLEIKKAELEKSTLKQKLYVPVINLRQIEVPEPITVCASSKCCKVITIGSVQKCDYIQKCHEPCYLKNVPREIIGAPELSHCEAMNYRTGRCTHCDCDFKCHMHVYYIAETYEHEIEDETVKKMINNKEERKKVVKQAIDVLEKRMIEYEYERNEITKNIAKFAQFLKHNSITAYNDAYKNYLNYLIQEQKRYGQYANLGLIESYQNMLVTYEEQVKILEDALKMDGEAASSSTLLSSGEIMQHVNKLFKLPHTGKKLESLFNAQTRLQSNEQTNSREYLHKKVPQRGFRAFVGRQINRVVNYVYDQGNSAQDNRNQQARALSYH